MSPRTRQTGFTLLEVMAALLISLAALAIGIHHLKRPGRQPASAVVT